MKKFINLVNLVVLVFASMVTDSTVQAGSGKYWGTFGGGVATGIIGTKLFGGRSRRYREPERVVVREVQTVQQPVPVQNSVQVQQLQSQIDQQQQLINQLRQDVQEERARARRAIENTSE